MFESRILHWYILSYRLTLIFCMLFCEMGSQCQWYQWITLKTILSLKTYLHSRRLGPVWLCYLNNSFHCLNNTICIFITVFHLHVFSQYLNNVTRTTLPNELGHMFLNNNKNAENIMHSYNNCFNL